MSAAWFLFAPHDPRVITERAEIGAAREARFRSERKRGKNNLVRQSKWATIDVIVRPAQKQYFRRIIGVGLIIPSLLLIYLIEGGSDRSMCVAVRKYNLVSARDTEV